jgi:hypothetical protein
MGACCLINASALLSLEDDFAWRQHGRLVLNRLQLSKQQILQQNLLDNPVLLTDSDTAITRETVFAWI